MMTVQVSIPIKITAWTHENRPCVVLNATKLPGEYTFEGEKMLVRMRSLKAT